MLLSGWYLSIIDVMKYNSYYLNEDHGLLFVVQMSHPRALYNHSLFTV